ncbi:hypothetical protein [Aestuariibaculum sediminum]|uniref:Uncharacterized protein n=1 Tax=Aestuariibaculum sediminum TaxID=2770637 RepID=A0A8J6Q1K6_9FLAO|nr:hypothetical protein [Aestuariibaculum sediminum]MBD0833047.1 hypothetical protein [Aestuariibaculum sediminum]
MRTLPKKLKLQNFKDVYILNKPESFNAIFSDVNYSESLVTTSCVECALVFVESKEDFVNQMLTLFPRLLDNSILWVFYPNETTISEISKLHIEFDWDFLGDYRLKPTKLLSVDDTWNAIKIKKILV